jgi:hypothetical protein
MNNNQGLTPNLPLWSFQIQSDSKLAWKSRKDLEIHLITRALKDEDFKQALIANPKAVIELELGAKLPEYLEINVLEETEDTIYMVLPCNPYEGISEEELQASLGMTYEDVAQWALDQQRNTLLDEESSVKLIAKAWRNKVFKKELLHNSILVIEQELGDNIQEGIKIHVFEETANILYILLSNIVDNFDIIDYKNDLIMSELNLPMVIGSGGASNNRPRSTTVNTKICCTV